MCGIDIEIEIGVVAEEKVIAKWADQVGEGILRRLPWRTGWLLGESEGEGECEGQRPCARSPGLGWLVAACSSPCRRRRR